MTGLNKKIIFITDLLDDNGVILSYPDFSEKYCLNCSQREYNKFCELVPLPLLHLIKIFMIYNNFSSVLPNLLLGQCQLFDKNAIRNLLVVSSKTKIFHSYNRMVTLHGSNLVISYTLDKAY